MEMLNPGILWGILAISAPIIIHFWHQKKGKVIEWAAMRWLLEMESHQTKGFFLKDILLLILRCLLILLLVFLLGKPILKSLTHSISTNTIHVIQANEQVSENFKFEIEKALKRGEKCIWISPNNTPLHSIHSMPHYPIADGKSIQKTLQRLEKEYSDASIHLYFLNTQVLKNIPKIYFSSPIFLHGIEYKQNTNIPFFEISDNQFVYRDTKGRLSLQATPPSRGVLKHKGNFNVLLETSDSREKAIIQSALQSISMIYGITFTIQEHESVNTKWDIIFKNKVGIKQINPEILYFLSNNSENKYYVAENIFIFPKALTPSDSPLVFEGQLPEYLLKKILKHYQMDEFLPEKSISDDELKHLFAQEASAKIHSQAWVSDIILLLFIILLSLERWLSIHKNI